MHTKDFLADELEKADLPEMAARARTGYYHDYLSPLPDPALQLFRDLEEIGTPAAKELSKRHCNGEFDANKKESDDWAKGPEGQAAFAQLMKSSKK